MPFETNSQAYGAKNLSSDCKDNNQFAKTAITAVFPTLFPVFLTLLEYLQCIFPPSGFSTEQKLHFLEGVAAAPAGFLLKMKPSLRLDTGDPCKKFLAALFVAERIEPAVAAP